MTSSKWLSVTILLGSGCGPGVGFSLVPGQVSFLNGPTNVSETGSGLTSSHVLKQGGEMAYFRLAPAEMSMRITGLSFLPEGFDEPKHTVIEVGGDCRALYDRSRGSLAVLSTCDLRAPAGRFGGVSVLYENDFEMLIDDAAASIYSDPGAPGGLASVRPAAGPVPIQIRDQNGGSDEGTVSIFFEEPVTVDEDHPGEVFVVFDPTHWIWAQRGNDGVFEAPRMAGNPPIIPSFNQFGKGALYSTMPSAMAFREDQCQGTCRDFLFLYADDATPVSVTWQLGAPCAGDHVVAFNGDGTAVGTYGRLGLDSAGTLAWASPAGMEGDHPPRITGYAGVFRMTEMSEIGDPSTLAYKCGTDVPAPISGRNYSSGAPEFTPDGTIELTLLSQ